MPYKLRPSLLRSSGALLDDLFSASGRWFLRYKKMTLWNTMKASGIAREERREEFLQARKQCNSDTSLEDIFSCWHSVRNVGPDKFARCTRSFEQSFLRNWSKLPIRNHSDLFFSKRKETKMFEKIDAWVGFEFWNYRTYEGLIF